MEISHRHLWKAKYANVLRLDLRRAKTENLLRLARSLKLHTEGMSHRQIASLVYWRITRNDMNRH
jgi:hypothetical protein